jgi:hypothetical protein
VKGGPGIARGEPIRQEGRSGGGVPGLVAHVGEGVRARRAAPVEGQRALRQGPRLGVPPQLVEGEGAGLQEPPVLAVVGRQALQQGQLAGAAGLARLRRDAGSAQQPQGLLGQQGVAGIGLEVRVEEGQSTHGLARDQRRDGLHVPALPRRCARVEGQGAGQRRPGAGPPPGAVVLQRHRGVGQGEVRVGREGGAQAIGGAGGGRELPVEVLAEPLGRRRRGSGERQSVAVAVDARCPHRLSP